MSTKDPSASIVDSMAELKDVDPALMSDFQKAMAEDVIPAIVKVVEERRELAATARQLQLKML